MRHHDSDPHDALNDYLDSLAGAPLTDSHAGALEPGLRGGVDQFFDLAERAGMASVDTRRADMNATFPASTSLAPPTRKPRRNVTLPAWTQHLHFVSTGLLIVAVIALSFAAFGPNGIRNGGNDGNGDGPSLNGAVPIATVPEGAETSSIPYPTADQCTVEPMPRDEMIAHIQEANVATAPEYPRYEQAIEASEEDAQAIMQAFDEWRACGLDTPNTGLAYQLRLQSSWYTANSLPILFDVPTGERVRPVDEQVITAYIDRVLEQTDIATPWVESEPIVQVSTMTPPNSIPIPEGATPIADNGSGRSFPTIFAEDIMIIAPNRARVQVYFVDEHTREVVPSTPLTYGFVKIDGQWLIDSYREGVPG